MKSNNHIYCTFCGTLNKVEDTVCHKCHRFLKRGDHPLVDYMEEKIIGKYQGKLKNSFFSILTNYIKSHLYGFILTCSIFVSATAMIVSSVMSPDSKIHYVDDKFIPQEVVSYQGDGLNSLEVTKKYIDAIRSGDEKVIKGLQLKQFYPEIVDEIVSYQAQNKLDFWDKPAISHHLVENRDIYFKMDEEMSYGNEYIGDSELVSEHQTYLDYTTDNYAVRFWYCSNHNCSVNGDGLRYSDFSSNLVIQLIEVAGNYYVLGEKVGIYMGQNEEVYHMALFRAEGDTTNLSFDDALVEFDQCDFNKECIIEHGFNNRDILNELSSSFTILNDLSH